MEEAIKDLSSDLTLFHLPVFHNFKDNSLQINMCYGKQLVQDKACSIISHSVLSFCI